MEKGWTRDIYRNRWNIYQYRWSWLIYIQYIYMVNDILNIIYAIYRYPDQWKQKNTWIRSPIKYPIDTFIDNSTTTTKADCP